MGASRLPRSGPKLNAPLLAFCTQPRAASCSLAGTLALVAGTTLAQPPVPAPRPNGVIRQADATPPPPQSRSATVRVDDNLIVDLHVADEDLANVLQMLSIQSQRNIVMSRNVSATVTANLYGVTFYEALDAILHVNGYGYLERGNFIYVYTLDELQKIEQAARQRVWKVIRLNYLNSVDAAEFVKPLLSEGGQIKVNGRPPGGGAAASPDLGSGEDFAHDATMIVYDFPENLAEIEKVVREMDTRPAQVLVEATVLQVSLNEANAFGIDFSIIGDLNFTDFVNVGGPLRAVDALISGGGSSSGTGSGSGSGSGGTGGAGTPIPSDDRGRALVGTAGNTAGPATLKLGIVQNDVAAFLRLLDEVSDTTILSRPNILTLNRHPARVLVGRKVGYLSTTSTDTSTTQTVEFLDTGTQLSVQPFVSSDGTIRMVLRPKVSEAVIRTVTNTGGAAVTIPDEISNELTANVLVRDGQTIVLGGLFREHTQASRRQVPFLGDVPLIGLAFRGHEDSTQRSEIIFMITPTIVSDTTLIDQGQRAQAAVERVRAGSREGLLPWSRDKRTQQMVLQATELARRGQTDQALYTVQRALRLNRFQPDAIALREMLMNKKAAWPTRSLLHEILTGEMERALSRPGSSAAPSGSDSPAALSPAAETFAPDQSATLPTSAGEDTPAFAGHQTTPDDTAFFESPTSAAGSPELAAQAGQPSTDDPAARDTPVTAGTPTPPRETASAVPTPPTSFPAAAPAEPSVQTDPGAMATPASVAHPFWAFRVFCWFWPRPVAHPPDAPVANTPASSVTTVPPNEPDR